MWFAMNGRYGANVFGFDDEKQNSFYLYFSWWPYCTWTNLLQLQDTVSRLRRFCHFDLKWQWAKQLEIVDCLTKAHAREISVSFSQGILIFQPRWQCARWNTVFFSNLSLRFHFCVNFDSFVSIDTGLRLLAILIFDYW